ncbi:galactosyltransferase Lgt5 [Moraxella sp. ZY210820]|uniref:galactosyltransferase Lgt5 n=1 Tax=unclassified Moraxella TaxID=2685852 RepID=UPI00272FE347|nr:galactosyltransferase Lgt5 [Moraxella sp. ZY210820]WLF83016.1 galactosyltransferase Lgt5 [Moraxella sp. ZY210820]
MQNLSLPSIHALWIGDTLGRISSCCLSSFVKQGHQVYLHTYGEIKDLPKGVIICDANHIIPKQNIIRHNATGSYALFSDIFRYELLKHIDHGIYVDCDVYCIKPLIIPEHGYLLGFEDDSKINGAILALPKESVLLQKLIEISHDENFIPLWYPKKKQRRLKFKKMLGMAKHIADMPWGAIGPEAITYFVQQNKILHYVQDIDILYPVHYTCIKHLINGNLDIADITTKRTLCVHLYNEVLRKIDLEKIDEQSVLAKMLNNEI